MLSNVRAVALLAVALALPATVAQSTAESFGLIFPLSQVVSGQRVTWGIDNKVGNATASFGQTRLVNFTLTNPNGTAQRAGGFGNLTDRCLDEAATSYTAYATNTLNTPGVYTLTTNVTYGAPSGVNCTAPFVFRSQIFTYGFSVVAPESATSSASASGSIPSVATDVTFAPVATYTGDGQGAESVMRSTTTGPGAPAVTTSRAAAPGTHWQGIGQLGGVGAALAFGAALF